jgi:RNA polymerase sigma-70 factor (ECF subfamily)
MRPRNDRSEHSQTSALAEDDELLVERIRAGDVDAVAAAYDRWHQRVRLLAQRLLCDEAAAEDVVQETFVAVPGAIRTFRREVPLESFVLAIAVKRARGHLRAVVRRRRAMENLSQSDWPRGRDPEEQTYRGQLAQRLESALDQLPAAQRVAFILCEIEELTSAKAAVLMGVPEATVRTRVFHGRRRLRELLSGEHQE